MYRWVKDGAFISGFTSEPFYKIISISRGDAGNYQCYARNEVGESDATSLCVFPFSETWLTYV